MAFDPRVHERSVGKQVILSEPRAKDLVLQAKNETLRVPSYVGQDDSRWQQIVRAPSECAQHLDYLLIGDGEGEALQISQANPAPIGTIEGTRIAL
jgi:hypothetical protein